MPTGNCPPSTKPNCPNSDASCVNGSWRCGTGGTQGNPTAPPTCPSGQHSINQGGTWTCVPNDTPGQCPEGQDWKYGTNGWGCYSGTTPAPSPTGGSQDCGPGMHWNNNAKECRPGPGPDAGGSSGGGAPAGGRAIPGTTAAAPLTSAAPGSDVEGMILDHIKGILSGQTDPFSDERVGRMKGQLFLAGRGQEKAQLDAFNEDLVSRGLYRSGPAARGALEIRNKTGAQYTGQVAGLLNEQEKARYQAKLDGLDRARQWLDAQRNYLLQKEDNQIKLQIGMAQINLGYAKISSEEKLLQMQLNAPRGGGGGGQTDEDLLWQIINTTPAGPAPRVPNNGGGR